MSATKLEPVYISAGCNRSPNCLAWRKDLLLYASCNCVVIASKDGSSLEAVATLCGHSDRVNCVRWVEGDDDDDESFVTASADRTAIHWKRRDDGQFRKNSILRGHSEAVTVCSGLADDASVLLVTAGGDCTIRTWHLADEGEDAIDRNETSKIDLGSGICMDLKVAPVGRTSALLLAAMDDCRIHLFGGRRDGVDFTLRHALRGHEDWVRCLDVTRTGGEDGCSLMLATGGQDGFVRVWKLADGDSTRRCEVQASNGGGDDGELKMKQEVFVVRGQDEEEKTFAVQLETVLAGHEDKVFAVQWKKS